MDVKGVTMAVRIPDALRDRVTMCGRMFGLSRSDIVRVVLEQYLPRVMQDGIHLMPIGGVAASVRDEIPGPVSEVVG
mgnify:CR=1 FL=1